MSETQQKKHWASMFVCFFGGQNFTSWWPRKKKPLVQRSCCPRKKGPGRNLLLSIQRPGCSLHDRGGQNWQTCKRRPRVVVVCPKPSPPLLSKEGRRAGGSQRRKKRTNERTNERGRRSACMREDQTRRCCCSLPQGVDGPNWNCASRVAAEEERLA